MLYLYKSPYVDDYVNTIRIKALDYALKNAYRDFIRSFTGMTREFNNEVYTKEVMDQVWGDFVEVAFDTLYDLLMIKVAPFHIKGYMETTFRRKKFKKAQVEEFLVSGNGIELHEIYDWAILTAKKARLEGLSFDIPATFVYNSLKNIANGKQQLLSDLNFLLGLD